MRDYADKLAEAAGEGLDADSRQHYARGSFALGLLLLGVPDEDEEPEDENGETADPLDVRDKRNFLHE